MSLDADAINAIIDQVTSHASQLGLFETVNFHEPKDAPGSGLTLAVWADAIEPIGEASGLSATSGYLVLSARVYGNMLQRPEDDLDPRVMSAVSVLLNAYSGDFDFGATIRCVDLLGMYGRSLSAQAGYVTVDRTVYRVMTVSIPLVVNDMWAHG